MALEPGSRLDAYEIVRPLGAGGMGEVWLATEVRLGRKVALKVLPADLTREPSRVQRFEQEARAASALNHPNVCTIHALGETTDGQHYIAMEYVEGKTLRQRLSTTRLSIREALDIAIQVAAALSTAHGAGIVHRDIKPENVMLRPDGFVKVLDFGLAKLAPAAPDVAGADTTRTMLKTDAGLVVGTAAYMSPEQARGQEVDARTDIWSLGVLLYEMVAGRSPFAGPTGTDVLAAILDREPAPVARFEPDTPAELQRILTKTLRKDRSQRYQTVQDLLLDLQAIREEEAVHRRSSSVDAHSAAPSTPAPALTAAPSSQAPLPQSRPRYLLRQASQHRVLAAVFGLVVLSALGGVVWWSALSRREMPHTVSSKEAELTRLTANPAERSVTSARISPDGRYLAYADATGLQIRFIDTGETQGIPDTQRMNVNGWSRDSTKVRASTCEAGACVSWDVSLVGGSRHRSRASWSEGDVVIGSADGSRLLRLTKGETKVDLLNGMPPRVVGRPGNVRAATWSADGERVFLVRADGSAVESLSVEGKSPVTVFTAGKDQEIQDVYALATNRLLLTVLRRATALGFAPEVSLHELRTNAAGIAAGPPRRLMEWQQEQLEQVSASTDGTRVAYLSTITQTDVYVADLDPERRLRGAPRRLTLDDRDDLVSAWLADNTTVLIYSTRNGTADIFKQRLDSGLAEPLVVDAGDQAYPQVTSDGQWVLYLEFRQPDTTRIMRIPTAGGTPQLLFTTPLASCRCSPRGRCVILERQGSVRGEWLGSPVVVSAIDPVRGKGAELARLPAGIVADSLSPDGDTYGFILRDEAVRQNHIRMISFSGQATKDIIVPGATNLHSLNWLSSGAGFFSVGGTEDQNEVLFITPEGKSRVVWSPAGLTPEWAIPSRDGKHLALLVTVRQRNAWMLTNF